jgi:hypothetical protein
MADSCEHGNEPSSSIKDWESLDQFSDLASEGFYSAPITIHSSRFKCLAI